MRIARYSYGGAVTVGIVDGGTVTPVQETLDDLVGGSVPTPVNGTMSLDDVELLAPLTGNCRGVLCVGINYVDHQQESADTFSANVPSDPIVFFKTPAAVTDPHARLVLDPLMSTEFDWEVELGVVIGRGGRDISREHAGEHVFGYTVVNDVTARDVQHRHKQWHLGKNVDASTPVGPWIVTADELGYPPALEMSLLLNGTVMQQANTADMVFDIAEQIAVVSRYVALRAGDVLATGTPAGVGFARTPPRFLTEGDVVQTRIEGIGELRNEVVTKVGTARELPEAVAS